jgi:hypothetical protein
MKNAPLAMLNAKWENITELYIETRVRCLKMVPINLIII